MTAGSSCPSHFAGAAEGPNLARSTVDGVAALIVCGLTRPRVDAGCRGSAGAVGKEPAESVGSGRSRAVGADPAGAGRPRGVGVRRAACVTMSDVKEAHGDTGRGGAPGAGGGAPGPAEMLPGLDDDQLRVLGQVGRAWARVSDDGSGRQWCALPVDPDLGGFPSAEDVGPDRFGRMVRVSTPGTAEAAAEDAPASGTARAAYRVRHALIGAPLKTSAVARERMRKLVALPVLSADALSSVAYGPEAMLTVLVVAGTAGLGYTTPIAVAIAFLMLAVGVSYRQTIRAYPHGGGSYIVAGDNLGRVPGLVAAAGLMTDYILTVAVSIAAGVAAITSALPSLSAYTVPIGVGVIALLLVGNLRGLRQAGALFAAPTYAFVIAMFALVAAGLSDAADRGFHVTPAPPVNVTEGVGLLLVMRAFASGATAMTGIEAISNAVPAFQPTEWRNARTTLTWMICLLITLFAGVTAVVTDVPYHV